VLPVVALVLEATTLALYSAADTTGILFAIGLPAMRRVVDPG